MPPHGRASPPPDSLRLTGGIVAHNEEHCIEGAIRSLLDQELPEGARWGTIWVVASGCTDGTVDAVRRWTDRDARIRLIVEEERTGKARALRQIFARAQGDALVLLNADARAEAGALASMIRVAPWGAATWAVMARPVTPTGLTGPWTGAVEAMWEIHHRFHSLLEAQGGGGHLSDELLLLSLPNNPPLPEGIICDGSYFGVWLEENGGEWRYAADARVAIQIPRTLQDHLHQRRRNIVGNQQVASVLGVPPTTLLEYSLSHPREGLDFLRSVFRPRRHGLASLVQFLLAEGIAQLLAAWDRLPPRRNHVLWRRIAPEVPSDAGSDPAGSRASFPRRAADRGTVFLLPAEPIAERRVATILDVARSFHTGVALDELSTLLPPEAPRTSAELADWLSARPRLARVEGGRAFHPSATADRIEERAERGHVYRAAAERLFRSDLAPILGLIRCAGLSGSAAYGEPEAGDDLDLFVVTRSGALWCFLAYTYLVLRLRSRRAPGSVAPGPCFNYVLTDGLATQEFAEARGFLFAREALQVRPLLGDPYYRGLLRAASWMEEEIPRRYDERTGDPGSTDPEPAALPVRLLNWALYLPLAFYIQLANQRRNAHSRWKGAERELFRTETAPQRLTFGSERFDELKVRYHGAGRAGGLASVRSPGPVRISPD